MQRNNYDPFELESYRFDLPEHLIAQFPLEPRDISRLLVLDRQSGSMRDSIFTDMVNYISKGDSLVINDTRVIPARLFGYKETGARVEILLLRKKGQQWESLVRPARRFKVGSRIFFTSLDGVAARVVADLNMAGGKLIVFENCPDEQAFINATGHMPLPPYIDRTDRSEDRDKYQTVYARTTGSAAAPTAGLHFTHRLLGTIREKGVNIVPVLLHVGLGTFRPVNTADIRQHTMHHEYYEINAEAAQVLNSTRANGKKIIAVGTTVVRTLETVYNDNYGFSACQGETDCFIYPGYRFKAIDKLITNFHLPGSSLLMLVSAFAGIDTTRQAYFHAIEKQYRFFSYGDAMLII